MEKVILGGILFLYVIFIYVNIFFGPNTLTQLGFLTALFSMIMFGSPLLSLSKVIQSKSTTGHISLPLASISLGVCIVWTLIGMQLNDAFVIVPNFTGGVLSAIQIAVYFYFRGAKRPSDDFIPLN